MKTVFGVQYRSFVCRDIPEAYRVAIAFIITAIFFSVISAIFPFRIGKFPVNLATGPILGVCALSLAGVIDPGTIKSGILGCGQIKPWEIIIIFFTAAYVSISVEVTGILDFFSYSVVKKSGGNGVRLFFFFYLFSCVLTVFTSNDIVILILTPIIFYLGKHAKLNVIPMLFAEFFGANTLSMFLYIGNPTNIIVGNALGLGFLEYTRIMWMPSVTAALANMALLYVIFKKDLIKKFQMNDNSIFTVRNWFDAVLSCVLLVFMLISLGVSRAFNIPIWVITSCFAFIFALEDIIFAIYYTVKHKFLPASEIVKSEQEVFRLYGIPEHRNEFWLAIKRIPWKILPFTLVFFVLMAALGERGVVDSFAAMLSRISMSTGGSIASNGTLALVLANIINNQPMTIFFSNVLVSERFLIPPAALKGGAYSVIIASNLGANMTLLGALAGLMWNKILKTKGLEISYVDFLKIGIIVTPMAFSLALIALYVVVK